jgi:eukaryotic-like serine/threonine-protein kinase
VEDAFYLISELVHGSTLGELIAAGELDDEHALEIGIALADALAHAHARGVSHRDVKPQNVLVPRERDSCAGRQRSSRAAAKLTDFGGARLAGTDVLTRTGDVLGTLAYMSPEQSEGEEAAEPADLYALALVLYESLCGINPVRAPTPAATVRRIGRSIAPLAGRRGDLPAELTGALDRALAPAPAERGTLDHLRLALERALVPRGARRDGAPAAGTGIALRRVRPPGERTGLGVSELPAWDPSPPRLREHQAGEGAGRPRQPRSRGGRARAPAGAPAVARATSRESEPQDVPAKVPGRLPRVPRRAWVAAAAALFAWQAAAGRAGVGLLWLAGLAPLALLAGPRRPSRRSGSGLALLVAALAPALGAVRLAGAFPAIAGQAPRWATRAALGAVGYWWLALAEPLLSRHLWLGPVAGTPARAAWEGSLQGAAAHVVGPLLTPGLLFGVLLWAGSAMSLPWIVRGRTAALDVVACASWSAAVAACGPLLRAGLPGASAHASPRGAVLGAVFGGLFAISARALRGPV